MQIFAKKDKIAKKFLYVRLRETVYQTCTEHDLPLMGF